MVIKQEQEITLYLSKTLRQSLVLAIV